MPAPFNSWQNYLLTALPAEKFKRISPHLELVQMPLGKILYESSDELHYVYFPTACIAIEPILALVIGILILLVPRILTYFVTVLFDRRVSLG